MALIQKVKDDEERKRKAQAQANQTAQTATTKAAQQNSDAAKRNSVGANKAPTQSAAATIQAAKQKAASGNVTKAPTQYADKSMRQRPVVKRSYNYKTLGTQERVEQVASKIADPKEKQGFLDGWTAYTETKSYKNDQKRKEQLQGLAGLYDADGRPININTASYNQVVQGIRSIADATKRNEAASKLEEMTKTWGSRFYGQTYMKDIVTSYLGNPDFTEATYKEVVKAYDNAFYAKSGYEEKNAEQYLSFYNAIDGGNYTDSVKRQLKEALNASWKNTTGKNAPSVQAVAAANEAVNTAQEAANVQAEEDQPNVFEQAWSAVSRLWNGDETTPEEAVEDAPTEEANGGSFMSGEWLMDPEWVEEWKKEHNGEMPKVSDLPGYNKYASATVSDVKQGDAPQYMTIKDDADVLRAYMTGQLDRVSEEDKAAFMELAKSPTSMQLLGTIADTGKARAALIGNEAAEQVVHGNIAALGTTAYNAYAAIMSEAFPAELREDAMMVLLSLGKRADDMQEAGTLGGDDMLPALERLLETDEASIAELQSIYAARDELIAQRNELRTQQEQQTQQALDEAREAVRIGEYSEDQLAMVQANIPADIRTAKLKDPTYKQMHEGVAYWDWGYFDEDGGAFFDSALCKNLESSGVTDTTDYRFALSTQMENVLANDTRTAMSLGMSLENYYARMGGMSYDTLANRASMLISEQGASVTQEEIDTLDQQTEGAGIGAGSTFGLGVLHGTNSLYASYADSLYIGLTEANVVRTASMMQVKYQQEYGILGREMYRADFEALLDGGTLDESYVKVLREAMDNTGDIFSLGIDPTAFEGLRVSGAKAEQNVNMMEAYVGENGTAFERDAFGIISGMTRNAEQALVGAGVTAITGNAKVGFAAAYSVPGFGDSVKQRYDEGYGRNTAAFLAAVDTAGSYLANQATFENILGRATGAKTLMGNALNWLRSGNPTGAVKAMAVTKAYAWGEAIKTGAKTLAQNIIDEAVFDEGKEGLMQSVINTAIAPIFRKADNGEDIGAADLIGALVSVKDVDFAGVAKDVANNFVNVALTSSIFAVAGAAGSANFTYKGVNTAQSLSAKADGLMAYDSVKLAVEIANGRSKDVQGFMDAYKADMKNPVFVEAFNTSAQEQSAAEKTAMNIAHNDGGDGKAKAITAKQEQIKAHEAKATASQTAIDTAVKSMNAAQGKIDNGTADEADVQVVIDGAESIAKNKNSLDESTREAEQKKAEVKVLQDEALQEARAKANRQQQAESARMRESLLNSKEAALADINSQLEAAETEMNEAVEAGDIARMEEIGNRVAELDNRRAELMGESLEEEAGRVETETEEERAEYEAYQQKQLAQQEADEMKPVYSTLAQTKVYVDESQRSNILSRTGLKNLGQVSLKYGLRLTSDKSKASVSLDGSFFADLAGLAPGRIDTETGHPEDALIDLVERKKQLKGKQASVGETAYEKYLPDGAFYATQDPVMQKTASQIYKRTGVEVVVAPLANGVRALYDRANNRIVLSSRIGAGEAMRKAAMHELTHYIEGGVGYDAYKEAVLKAAYPNDNDGELRTADETRIKETYENSGIALDEAGVEKELVAEATEKIINDPDGRIVQQILDSGDIGVIARLKAKLQAFLARRKAKKEGTVDAYDVMRKAQQKLSEALKAAGKRGADPNAETDVTIGLDTMGRKRGELAYGAEGEQVQYALVGRNPDGKGIYTSNYEADTPRQVKIEHFVDLWQNVWSKKPISLSFVDKNGQQRDITANFDPDYDPDNKRYTDLGKVVHSKNGSSGDRTITLNLADDLHDMAADAQYYASEDERGKATDTHKGVREWHYFSNDFIYRDESGDKPMTLWMDIKEKTDGGYVYQLYAKKTKENASAPPREISSARQAEASSVDTIIAESESGVNTQYMQEGIQYALAPNQFANETVQKLNTFSDETKAVLDGRGHEGVANAERMDAAWQAMNERGRDSIVDELMDKPVGDWTPQDHVNAALCSVLAEDEGDLNAAARILLKYDEAGTVAGQTLQARKIIQRMTPFGAIAETIRSANRKNAGKGIPADSFPAGEEAPKVKQNTVDADGNVTRKTIKKVAEVYDEASGLMRQLDQLPGDVSYDNPWGLPLSDKQMALIRAYRLEGQKLPGINYNTATKKQRMLAAIIAANNDVQGSGLETIAQQIAAIDKGYAVVTAADMHYISSQMSEFKAIEGTNATEALSQAGKNALGRAWQAQDNVNTDGFMSQWGALRYMNMLSSPATWTRNVTSNVLNAGLEKAATRVAVGIDKAVAKKTGTRTTDVATREERRAGKAAFSKEVAQTVTDYFVTHTDTGHGRKYGPGHTGRVFQNEFLETYRNLVDFAMQIGDRPFYEQCYTEELAIIQRIGMKKTETSNDGTIVTRPMTEAEMKEEAVVRATKRVFQEDSSIVNALNGLRGDPTADLVLSTLIPFVKTPSNVAMRAIDYSPAGLAITIARRGYGGIDTGKFGSISQREYVMNMGRGLTGTGLMVIGWALASAGLIGYGRGEEENKKRRNVLSTLGEPYSMYIDIGGTKHEIDWALPMAAAIAAGADFAKRLDDGEGGAQALFSAVMAGVGDQLFSTPMLSSMQEIFQGYGDTVDIGTRLFLTGTTSLVNQTLSPAMLRAIAKYTDPYVRDTTDSNAVWASLKQNVIQYWPVMRGLLPVATDLTGDAMLQTGYWNYGKEHANAALHFLDSFFTPTATIGTKNDDALWELIDLSYEANDTACLPTSLIDKKDWELSVTASYAKELGYKKDGKGIPYTIDLTDDEKRQVNQEYGNLLFNGSEGTWYTDKEGKLVEVTGLRDMMKSAEWEQADPAGRVDLVEKKVKEVKLLIMKKVTDQKKRNGEL